MRREFAVVVCLAGFFGTGLCRAQSGTVEFTPVAHFPLNENGPVIRRHTEAGKPFTISGQRGVIVGQQEGTFEAWILPIKLLSHLSIRAEVEGYSVPIELNPTSAEIEVFPDHTTITYSHLTFTVKQTMFAPDDAEDGTGAVTLFQFDSVRPMNLTFSFTPEVKPMWPQPSEGIPSPEWIKRGNSGFYVLHLDLPDQAAAVTIPTALSGVLAPYQEKPQVHPLELRLHYDPKRDGDRYFPLLMAVGITKESSTNAALEARLNALDQGMANLYAAHAKRYRTMMSGFTSIETPDTSLNEAFRWAEVSIEQLRAKAQPSGEVGLVAGYFSSGDSARPGFGWFFGRDSLYTLYAVNGYGDFQLSRDEFEFLLKRQRDDGKIMHEYSQTAAFVDWKAFSYMYAAADSTPLFLTALLDYVKASGDVEFLKSHREQIEKAWQFETTHDSDGDGIYDNAQGTGWVESWPSGMPHQEVYLALLDQQASVAMSEISKLLGDDAGATKARTRAEELSRKIEKEYYDTAKNQYSFSRNADGSVDRTASVYPTVAWWNGHSGLAHPEESLNRWASHDFATDWGLRDVAEDEPFYDAISYHQGSVWPLFTGWASIAEYRAGRPLSGYAHLMQNADLTTAQDLGAVTELLSGAYFQPFGRSTSHQLWSSAMVITPALRGLFGIEVDAVAHAITLRPQLPADWDHAAVRGLRVGNSLCDLEYKRQGALMIVELKTTSGPDIKLLSDIAGATSAVRTVRIPLPGVEVAIPHGLPLPGARTTQLKVISQSSDAHSLHLKLEAQGGSVYELPYRRNVVGAPAKVEGGEVIAVADGHSLLRVQFPTGSGYQKQDVAIRW